MSLLARCSSLRPHPRFSHFRLYTSTSPSGVVLGSDSDSDPNEADFHTWTRSVRNQVIHHSDELTRSKLRDLYYTLPTRSPKSITRTNSSPPSGLATLLPSKGEPIFPLHCLAFFHPRVGEDELSEDLTEREFAPPGRFGARRMWVGGVLRFLVPATTTGGYGDEDNLRLKRKQEEGGLCVGDEAIASVSVSKVEKKGSERGSPIVFLHKDIDYVRWIGGKPVIKERRVHAYLSEGTRPSGDVREVAGLTKPQFTYAWTPTATTLFRFSALMWNAHLIHLDREYTRKKEGYPDLLVHGPLTAMMLVEAFLFSGLYKGEIDSFEYRARNPVYVDRKQYVRGAVDESQRRAVLWAEDEDGVVGMTGSVGVHP